MTTETNHAVFIKEASPLIVFIESSDGPTLPSSLKILNDGSIHIVLAGDGGTSSHPDDLITAAICMWAMDVIEWFRDDESHMACIPQTMRSNPGSGHDGWEWFVSPPNPPQIGYELTKERGFLASIRAICEALGYKSEVKNEH